MRKPPASVFEKLSAKEFKFVFLPFLMLLTRRGNTVQSFQVISHAHPLAHDQQTFHLYRRLRVSEAKT